LEAGERKGSRWKSETEKKKGHGTCQSRTSFFRLYSMTSSTSSTASPVTPSTVEGFYTRIRDRIRANRPTLKESSITAYINSLKKLSQDIFGKPTFSTRYFHDIESIKSRLESARPNPSTRSNVLSSIIVYLKSLPDFPTNIMSRYSDWQAALSRTQREKAGEQSKSDREETNWMTIEDLQRLKSRIQDTLLTQREGSKSHLDYFQRLIVLSLYTDIPPLRNDYANVKVLDVPESPAELNVNTLNTDHNYIHLPSGQLVLCNYKTNKTYGVKCIDLPQHLITLIRSWMRVRGGSSETHHRFLLINICGDRSPMTKNGLTKYLNKLCAPKKVSTTMLRKIYLSHKYPVIHTLQEMQKDSYIMGHSIGTQQYTYRKK